MSRFASELDVVPRAGVILSSIIAAAAFTAFVIAVKSPHRVLLGLLMAVVILVYGLLVAYVYGDAKRRGMRAPLWTLIALFVPNALGFLLYFLLREPLMLPCPSCGAAARRDFTFCPQCGAALSRTCPSCRRPVEPGWPHCAHCGHALLGGTASAPPGTVAT